MALCVPIVPLESTKIFVACRRNMPIKQVGGKSEISCLAGMLHQIHVGNVQMAICGLLGQVRLLMCLRFVRQRSVRGCQCPRDAHIAQYHNEENSHGQRYTGCDSSSKPRISPRPADCSFNQA